MRTVSVLAATGTLALGALLVPAAPASAATPDIACLKASISTLRSAGLLGEVARNGLPISLAVSLGVTPRAGTDVSALPDPLPLSVVLADHRAGANSLFIYPWCE
jgi:hypothetical protein